jgi:hypothetical protein
MRSLEHTSDDCIRSMKGRDHIRGLRVDRRAILKLSLCEHVVSMLIGIICLRTESRGGLLWIRNDNLRAMKGGQYLS